MRYHEQQRRKRPNYFLARTETPLQFAKAIATAMFGTAQEKADLAAVKEFQKTGCGYSAVQRTKPQTLAFGRWMLTRNARIS